MICNTTKTIQLTETELNVLTKAMIILSDFTTEIRNSQSVEINNSDWSYDQVDEATCLLGDLCAQGAKLIKVYK